MNEASIDESRLIAATLDGDGTAFEQLIRRHQSVVRNLLRRMTRDAHLADDLAQGTFLHAWQKLASFRGGSFRSWLCTIAYREGLQHLRKSEIAQSNEAVLAEAPVNADAGARMDLGHAIEALSTDQRHAILLSSLADMSHAEIATATGWPLGTVKSHLARAKTRLRALLEGYADDFTQ